MRAQSSKVFLVVGALAVVGAMAMTSCGGDVASELRQPAPEALASAPEVPAATEPARVEEPHLGIDPAAHQGLTPTSLPTPTGLGPELGVVVSSGVSAFDDRPPPPDFARSE